MASKYERPNSSFWWVKYNDGVSKTPRREPTKFRVDNAMDTREANMYVAQLTLEEKSRHHVKRDANAFPRWVPDFLRVTYSNSPRTLEKYESSWKAIEKFLATSGISAPLHVERKHITEFLKWRTSQKVPGLKGKKEVCRNSAISDLVIWRIIMFEAQKRGYVRENVISKFKLRRDKPEEKPELTSDQIQIIREALRDKPEWMRISFEIALYQGCRFSETFLPLSRVNLANNEITFHIKRDEYHTTRLHHRLKPLFKKMLEEGREYSFQMPERNASRDWSRFFNKLKLGENYCFHCTRVTAVTMLARGNVNEQMACRYIGHSTEMIHRIYQRLKVQDLGDCVSAISFESNENPVLKPAKKVRVGKSSASRKQRCIPPSSSSKRRSSLV